MTPTPAIPVVVGVVVMVSERYEQATVHAQPADHYYRKTENPPQPPQHAMEHVTFLFWTNTSIIQTGTLRKG